jgi:hypothetical protein
MNWCYIINKHPGIATNYHQGQRGKPTSGKCQEEEPSVSSSEIAESGVIDNIPKPALRGPSAPFAIQMTGNLWMYLDYYT